MAFRTMEHLTNILKSNNCIEEITEMRFAITGCILATRISNMFTTYAVLGQCLKQHNKYIANSPI